MGKYKICVYAICKDEEGFADRWMDSVGEADLVIVADTGSADGTVGKLRARGAEVYCETIDPWRFDAARNAAMDRIPEDVDICVSVDLDEVFLPGWREKLEDAWEPRCTRARYLYTWQQGPDGRAVKQFPRDKIHRRQGFRWVHPVHEVLEYAGPDPEYSVWVEGLVVVHLPDPAKSRGQYLPLLELSARENPQDSSVIFWLGREYLYHRQHRKCIDTLGRYLELPGAVWNEERCAAMRFIAACHEAGGNTDAARAWLFKAVAECPGIREPYLQMARLGYRTADWPLVFHMAHEALRITGRSGSYLFEPEAWGYALYDLGAIACYRLGMYSRSHEYALEALRVQPGDERLRRNLELIAEKL